MHASRLIDTEQTIVGIRVTEWREPFNISKRYFGRDMEIFW